MLTHCNFLPWISKAYVHTFHRRRTLFTFCPIVPRPDLYIGNTCSQMTGPTTYHDDILDVFFDLFLNKRLSKQSRGWWFETPSRPLWRHCNVRWMYGMYWDLQNRAQETTRGLLYQDAVLPLSFPVQRRSPRQNCFSTTFFGWSSCSLFNILYWVVDDFYQHLYVFFYPRLSA